MIGDDPSGLLLSVGWPDLDDPCTLGGLLSLVREAYGTQGHARMVGHRWRYEPGSWYECQPTHDTEAEALVAALEAAGGEE